VIRKPLDKRIYKIHRPILIKRLIERVYKLEIFNRFILLS